MIEYALAEPITKYATRAFEYHHDPDQPSIFVIFSDHWEGLLSYTEQNHLTTRDDAISDFTLHTRRQQKPQNSAIVLRPPKLHLLPNKCKVQI